MNSSKLFCPQSAWFIVNVMELGAPYAGLKHTKDASSAMTLMNPALPFRPIGPPPLPALGGRVSVDALYTAQVRNVPERNP
ncbi:hypothetical protein WME95_42355 [Sorangium sp. So ce327]|uniref:hypothetical protein n=1 Tax=unclassified Sorangium TaxID=2621164 RepID=UPI003F5E6498